MKLYQVNVKGEEHYLSSEQYNKLSQNNIPMEVLSVIDNDNVVNYLIRKYGKNDSKSGLFVVIRDEYSRKLKKVPVATIKEASEVVRENALLMGSSEWYGWNQNDVGYVYFNGKSLCKVSYNGRVWTVNKNQEEAEEIDVNIKVDSLLYGIRKNS
ncbi:MAG: hypothetical protein ACOCQR_01020 [bacterium]